jgi:sodium transport system ATP-binding protein
VNEILTLQGLTKTFTLSRKQQKREQTRNRVKVAVDNLSFTAVKGEVFGLLGPNGAGKTTTLRMLATLLKPDSGEALVDGVSVTKNPAEVRRKIGFLTGDLRLEEFFTPSYLFDFFAALHDVKPDIARSRKAALFGRCGVDAFANEKTATLSTGMKQKVSLLISLVHDPDIIIFDEPTNGLDVITAKVVTDFLLELKAQGKSIIVSTHIFSLAEKICDRLGIIMDGRMIRCGTIDSITAGKNLEDTFFDLYENRNPENTKGAE